MKSDKQDTEWWIREYAEDVHSHWKRRELQLPSYHEQSPQLIYRRNLVDYIRQICKFVNFCTRVKHLAIYYLDIFMDHHDIKLQHLQYITVCCLIVAVKVDENGSLILKMSEFSYLLRNKYTVEQLTKMELEIMKFLKWELLVPTAAAFAEYYILHSANETDVYSRLSFQSIKQAKCYLQRYVDYFLEIALQDHVYRKFRPSFVAASAVALSRLCLGIKPLWPEHLLERTGCSFEDFNICFSRMITSVRTESVSGSPNGCNNSASSIDADNEDSDSEDDDDDDTCSVKSCYEVNNEELSEDLPMSNSASPKSSITVT